MSSRMVLVNEQVREKALFTLKGLPVDGSHEVVIGPHERNRSAEQKGYYFLVTGIIANEFGWRQSDMHDYLKRTFLLPIFMADPKKDKFRERVELIHAGFASKAYSEAQRDNLLSVITSTNDATQKNMSAYLEEVAGFAADHSIRLPYPEYK